MDHDRRYVLAALVLVVGAVTAYLLRQVLPTVFFAITVAYLLAPVQDWFERRGLPSWWASVGTTVTTSVVLIGVVSPLLYVLYLRSEQLLELLGRIPSSITVSQFGYTATVTVDEVVPLLEGFVEGLALAAAAVAPVLAIKLTVFAIVVFALLMARQRVHDAARAVIPLEYHDVAEAMADRARDTLFAIYVLQAATATATFLVALPIFFGLGYDYPVTLSTIAGVLQFVPIVGPSVLVGSMAVFDLVLENTTRGILVAVLGMVFIAYLPDPVVRPRLARRTADLPGSLYFVGFTGGLFTLGVVGVIAGPLLVALFAESVELLSEEMDEHRNNSDDDGGGNGDGDRDGGSGDGDRDGGSGDGDRDGGSGDGDGGGGSDDGGSDGDGREADAADEGSPAEDAVGAEGGTDPDPDPGERDAVE